MVSFNIIFSECNFDSGEIAIITPVLLFFLRLTLVQGNKYKQGSNQDLMLFSDTQELIQCLPQIQTQLCQSQQDAVFLRKFFRGRDIQVIMKVSRRERVFLIKLHVEKSILILKYFLYFMLALLIHFMNFIVLVYILQFIIMMILIDTS